MNGATALPSAKTISAPHATNISISGIIQNFLRAHMKRENSLRKSMGDSELIPLRFRQRPGRRSRNPVAARFRLPLQAERILAGYAHQERDRRDGAIKQNDHDHRIR